MGKKFIAVRPHGSVPHPIDYRELTGRTRQEVLDAAFADLGPGYYVSAIHVEGDREPIWREHDGWTTKADQVLPEE